jgi:hypothetical protein
MAQYTAKDLRSITKNELIELLKKEGIEYDANMPYFALRAKLLNKDENKDDDSMARKNNKVEEIVKDNATEEVKEVIEEVKEVIEEQAEVIEQPQEVKAPEETKPVSKPKPIGSGLKALRGELVKRKGGKGLGVSAFSTELAKRKGQRVTGVTFAQELKSRQLKYKSK